GSKPAGIFTRERLGARTKQGDKEILAHQRHLGIFPATNQLWQTLGRPAPGHQGLLPGGIEGEEGLTDRLVKRAGLWAVVKQEDIADFSALAQRFCLDKDLADQRSDRRDGAGQTKSPSQGKGAVIEAGADTITCGPDDFTTWQLIQRFTDELNQ